MSSRLSMAEARARGQNHNDGRHFCQTEQDMTVTAVLTGLRPCERFNEERLRFDGNRLVRLGVEGDADCVHDDETPVLG